ncbi:MAG: tyrosine-type recombinase/integrase [Solirubrobacterales bacterium]
MENPYISKAKEKNKEILNDEFLLQIYNRFSEFYFTEVENSEYVFWAYVSFLKTYGMNKIDWFTWDNLCKSYKSISERHIKCMITFFRFLVLSNSYTGKYEEYLKNNIWILESRHGLSIKDIFYNGSKPYYFEQFIFEKKIGESETTRYNFNTDNKFIRRLLVGFVNTIPDKEKGGTRFKVFVYYFDKSLYALNNKIERIEDFNYEVFVKQYRFYKRITWGNHKATCLLTRFYIYLLEYIEKEEIKHKLFTSDNPIDKYYLYKTNFSTLYSAGFKVVYLNIFDEVPSFDRWLLAPNGQENFTIATKEYEYAVFDFSDIEDLNLKYGLKKWIWQRNVTVYSKSKNYYLIKTFIKQLNILRDENKIDETIIKIPLREKTEDIITADEVIAYRLFIMGKHDKNHTRNKAISAVKDYLSFIRDTGLMKVEDVAFTYLKLFDKREIDGGNPILKDDLQLITKEYKRLAENEGSYYRLNWIIYNLCVTTNLRISEVLGLKTNCLDEKMKKGQYAIMYDSCENPVLKVKRKASGNAHKEENINKYTERLIREAIKITEAIRKRADKKVSKYVFLVQGTKGKVVVLSKDRFYHNFKRVLEGFELKGGPYTVYNLRDTFMTNIYEQGKKDGKRELDIHIQSGHADIRTTFKHYVKISIKSYLEAMYGVIVGDVNIKGVIAKKLTDVMEDIPENIENITVNDQCGFCGNKSCNDNEISCLICDDFITTLDRIPYFKKKVASIDEMIAKEADGHGKEHLIGVKKLYVGFIQRLYELKGGEDYE